MTSEVLKQIWSEWEIEEKPLGKGSFGVVYKAVRSDYNVKSYAAIKAISIPSDPSEVDSLRSEGLDINATKTFLHGIVDDFVNEIQLMESLKGVQNIVSVEDYKVVEKTDEIGWDIYIRMELLTTFNVYICDKKLTEEEVIKLGCDICTALEICGQRNIIHRDIKPENIFINDFGYFKLGDFGIARKLENMTGGLSQKGTFNYMAPEVATGSDYDSRVDTYSLGIVLYRLLNGNKLPFLDTEKQLLNPNERRDAVDRRLRGEALPAPCDASPAMADLILRACAHNPDLRFSSATEMKQALMSVANGTYSAIGAADPNGTISVRRAPAVANQQAGQMVNTFGPAPKKNFKPIIIIASALAVAILVGVGFLVIPKLLKNNDSDSSNGVSGTSVSDASASESADYSKFDEEQISAIISEAETLATGKDYEGALTKIKTGLVTYPKSKALQDKEKEYTDAFEAQIKENTLKEAEGLAASGDYVSAIALIKNAQDTHGDNTDYRNAYESYCFSYKSKVIGEADALANSGNYDGANQKINEAIAVLGEDKELTQKIIDFQLDSYISKAEAYAENKNFVEALATLDTAQQILGEHERINEERFKIQKGQLLNTVAQYEEAADYAAAIGAIEKSNPSLKSDTEIIQKLNVLQLTYKDNVLLDAESAFKTSGYADAIKVLNDSLSVFPNDEQINAAIEEYSSYAPISIAKLDYFKGHDFGLDNNKKDNLGNTHNNVVYPKRLDGWSNATTTNVYKLNKQYSKLSGLWFQYYECRTSNMPYSDYKGTLEIYGDDKLLYSGEMGSGIEPISININISYVNELKIHYFGGGTDGSYSGIENFCVQK